MTNKNTKIAIIGAAGRMGQRIAALAAENDAFQIVCATEYSGSPDLGKDLGQVAGVGPLGVEITDELTGEKPDVAIDFSLPDGTMKFLAPCRDGGIAMVIGTTGLTAEQEAEIDDATKVIPIVKAGNYSLGITLLCKLVATAAKALGENYDVEITETHHRFKQDAPSGTAIMLARSVCDGEGKDYETSAVHGREGEAPRQPGEIGMHAIRLGDTIGEHTVSFGSLGETVTLGHSAHTRDTFVRGALHAGQWLQTATPGMYDMADVLGL
ncbi:MAG: 4-hydroxy-tetrahydrodipicolinate reductase [Phycisphaerales bacterium]|jgi:4-hydroxy-tetrahydrodipicolinate reductase|nr:4-hydroxy-tetrahydrodipicolinate reductase [Phycisphaerales bacterium]